MCYTGVTTTTKGHRAMTTNPYAAGPDHRYDTPDTGSYHPVALMADGGYLCEHCVVDPTNPVQSSHDLDEDEDAQWTVTGWFSSGETDERLECDHCYRVISGDHDEDQ